MNEEMCCHFSQKGTTMRTIFSKACSPLFSPKLNFSWPSSFISFMRSDLKLLLWLYVNVTQVFIRTNVQNSHHIYLMWSMSEKGSRVIHVWVPNKNSCNLRACLQESNFKNHWQRGGNNMKNSHTATTNKKGREGANTCKTMWNFYAKANRHRRNHQNK